MKFVTAAIILATSAVLSDAGQIAATRGLRKKAPKKGEAPTKEFAPEVDYHVEMNEDGIMPGGRRVHPEEGHAIEAPVTADPGQGGGHGRELGRASCLYCWWDSWYGYVTYCCDCCTCAYFYC